MDLQTIQETRIQFLNDADVADGDYVLYWMQQSQRADENHALEYAIWEANRLGQGVLAAFGLTDDYPEANLRHHAFMLEGLRETQQTLVSQGIRMVVQKGDPAEVAIRLARNASLLVCDCGYLRHQKAWRDQVAQHADCQVVQVESDVIVPVHVVSDKAEYAARTIRPRIHRNLGDYLTGFEPSRVRKSSLNLNIRGIDLEDSDAVLRKLRIARDVPAVSQFFRGGTSQAKQRFGDFIRHHLPRYLANRNQPQTDDISHMSPYLHFGQISPLYLALQMTQADNRLQDAKDAFLEELIVRRELAMNFVNYTRHYDSLRCLPNWASQTLDAHTADLREHLYTRQELEHAQTHDEYWNAAMLEMKHTGFMHNHMRMYWGKKILEWSESPQSALERLLFLNNRYFLDGRDPNSFAGAAWIFGVHDRAWGERPIFGKIRYMAASGLKRKCDIGAYVRKVGALLKAA